MPGFNQFYVSFRLHEVVTSLANLRNLNGTGRPSAINDDGPRRAKGRGALGSTTERDESVTN